FLFHTPVTTLLSTLSLHDALPICSGRLDRYPAWPPARRLRRTPVQCRCPSARRQSRRRVQYSPSCTPSAFKPASLALRAVHESADTPAKRIERKSRRAGRLPLVSFGQILLSSVVKHHVAFVDNT